MVKPQKTVKVASEISINWTELPFEQSASRFELFARIVWGLLFLIIYLAYTIAFGIIITVFCIVAMILNTIQWFAILIFGKRMETAFFWNAQLNYERWLNYTIRLLNYELRFLPYFHFMTDKRPTLNINDKNINYFKQFTKRK